MNLVFLVLMPHCIATIILLLRNIYSASFTIRTFNLFRESLIKKNLIGGLKKNPSLENIMNN